jgi:hypothetical protein
MIRRNSSPRLVDDGLPFASLLIRFAECLPNAPERPELQLRLPDVNALLQEYVNRMATVC